MTRLIAGLTVLAVLAVGIVAPQSSEGSVLTGTAQGMIGGKLVTAYFQAQIVQGGKLRITLTNTGPRSDYTPAQVLTDISFNMEGVDFLVGPESGSSVFVPLGSAWYPKNHGAPLGDLLDVSSEWGLARNTTLFGNDSDPPGTEYGPYDYSVTAASFGGTETRFAAGSLGGVPGLDGADFGLVSDPLNLTGPPLDNRDYIIDSVLITLSAVDSITGDPRSLKDEDLSLMSDVTFSYGSEHTGIKRVPDKVIPEPASLIVWSLLGALAIGVGCCGRRATM